MTVPAFLRPLYNAWMAFSKVLGRIMGAIMLTVIWVVLFGIYAIVMKIGRLFAKKKDNSSTWIDCSHEDATTMKRPF